MAADTAVDTVAHMAADTPLRIMVAHMQDMDTDMVVAMQQARPVAAVVMEL